MAPNSEYLADSANREKLAAHNPRLFRKTTYEYIGEEPEVHWTFNRQAETDALAAFLAPFAAPDFTDGKVTVNAAAVHVYGNADEWLTRHIASTMLQPMTPFNAKHASNGLVYVAMSDGTIVRGDRLTLAMGDFVPVADKVRADVARTSDRGHRRLERQAKRAYKIAGPDGKAELDAMVQERRAEILAEAQARFGD